MTVPDFVLFLLTGRLLTWFIQTNGLSKPLWQLHPALTELSECDLCLGFWVFLFMSFAIRQTISDRYPAWLTRIIQAALSTLTAHLIRLGWHSKFGVTVM